MDLRASNLATDRRIRAIFSYYTAEDIAAHLAAVSDGGVTSNIDGVVRKVWINHKLVNSIREIQKEMGYA